MASLAGDEEVVRWTEVPPGYTEEDARAWLARMEDERKRGRWVFLAVASADGGEPLGACDLRVLDQDRGVGEIGFWLAAHARGHGIMSRAVRLIARWAFHELGVARVQLLAHPDNEPSIRVAERAGFVREGLLRAYRVAGDAREDRVMFSLLPEELS
jgi:RimJ/RimL family protein N-acetyltransferase